MPPTRAARSTPKGVPSTAMRCSYHTRSRRPARRPCAGRPDRHTGGAADTRAHRLRRRGSRCTRGRRRRLHRAHSATLVHNRIRHHKVPARRLPTRDIGRPRRRCRACIATRTRSPRHSTDLRPDDTRSRWHQVRCTARRCRRTLRLVPNRMRSRWRLRTRRRGRSRPARTRGSCRCRRNRRLCGTARTHLVVRDTTAAAHRSMAQSSTRSPRSSTRSPRSSTRSPRSLTRRTSRCP